MTQFSWSRLAVRRHIGTLVLSTVVVVLGSFFIRQLNVDLLPSITYPRIAVQLSAPGISPEVAVDEITRPLEQTLAATEGVEQIFSRTREGQVRVDLFFRAGGDLDRALNDVTATFNRGRSRLPDDIENIRIFKFDPSQLPVYELALTAERVPITELRRFADEELARELQVVPGVAAVDVTGGVREEVQVNLDLARMQALGIPLSDVTNALRDRNLDISGGRVEGGAIEPLTRAVGRLQSGAEIENLVFAAGNRRFLLRDFAQVRDGTEKQRVFASLNGTPAVRVSVQKQPDANTIEVVTAVKARLARLQTQGLFPSGTVLTATLDDSRPIRAALANVTTSGLIGAALAALSVLVFLGSVRQTLAIALAIPLSTFGAVMLMGLFGLSLNLFSLGGLALGVGIVVDNAIVMLESIAVGTEEVLKQPNFRFHEFLRRLEQSSGGIESALVAATSTNLVAVVPFLFIGGFLSLLFHELILTISFAVAASIVVAVTVVPAFLSRTLPIRATSGLGRSPLWLGFDRSFQAGTASYGHTLQQVLRWRWLVVLVVVLGLGGSSLWTFQRLPREIVPPVNTGNVNVGVQFPPGTTLDTNRAVMAKLDELLQKQPETEYVFLTAGGSLFGNNTNANPLRGGGSVVLKPGTNAQAFVQKVSREVGKLNLAGIRVRLTPERVRGILTNNSPVPRTDIDILLQGTNPEVLESAGREVLAVLDEKVKGASFRPDTDARQPEYQVRPDWERLAQLGLTANDVGQLLRVAVEGTVPTQLQRGERLVDVRLQIDPETLTAPSQLAQLPLLRRDRAPVLLGDVAQVVEALAPGEIQRINQRYVFLILGNLERGADLGRALQEVEQVLREIALPDGVTLLPSSAAVAQNELAQAAVTLSLLAAFLVFAVMAVQYNSLVDPLAIMLAVPLALAGGIFGLGITGKSLSAIAAVGAILLVGIAVNNAIVLVELANQIREQEGVDRFTAMVKAAPQRLRPILMTTATTVLGSFPMALGLGEGGEFLQPLGIVVFAGLSVATLLTLFVVPCFYLLLYDLPKLGARIAEALQRA
ncbi:MAG: efflux RND transporter permease subunit [Pseudanabaenaceae cyanobacterium]